jgi:hypothetical protein
MPQLNIGNAASSNFTGDGSLEVQIPTKQTDGINDGDEYTRWENTEWSKQWGYFNTIPELKSALIMKAIWVCGKGYTTDPETKVILDNIKGIGFDTFQDILFNMEVIKRVAGDAFAEKMYDDEGNLINLKPIDPGSMVTIIDKYGMIKGYEQTSKVKGQKPKKFSPDEIFHLSHNRLADQCHGISDISSMEKTLLAEYESFDDAKKIMHRQAKPLIMFKLGTDDTAKINSFIAKMDKATRLGENIYIPDDENSVSYEVINVNVTQMILQWRSEITNKLYRAVGLPLILFGAAGSTESGGKIEYLAHEQVFKKDQICLEMQIENQLGVKISLVPPTSLLNDLQTDQQKDANQGLEIQPQDATAGAG